MELRILLVVGVGAILTSVSAEEGSIADMFKNIEVAKERGIYTDKDCEYEVNDIRRRYAHKHSIGNMNKLVYDFKLAEFLEKQEYNTMECLHYTYKTQNHSGEFYGENLREMGKELANPGATKVACFKKCTTRMMPMMIIDLKPEKEIPGEAGSKCGEGRIGVEGLCVVDLSPKTTPKPIEVIPKVDNSPPSPDKPSNSAYMNDQSSFMERSSYWISIMMVLVWITFM